MGETFAVKGDYYHKFEPESICIYLCILYIHTVDCRFNPRCNTLCVTSSYLEILGEVDCVGGPPEVVGVELDLLHPGLLAGGQLEDPPHLLLLCLDHRPERQLQKSDIISRKLIKDCQKYTKGPLPYSFRCKLIFTKEL